MSRCRSTDVPKIAQAVRQRRNPPRDGSPVCVSGKWYRPKRQVSRFQATGSCKETAFARRRGDQKSESQRKQGKPKITVEERNDAQSRRKRRQPALIPASEPVSETAEALPKLGTVRGQQRDRNADGQTVEATERRVVDIFIIGDDPIMVAQVHAEILRPNPTAIRHSESEYSENHGNNPPRPWPARKQDGQREEPVELLLNAQRPSVRKSAEVQPEILGEREKSPERDTPILSLEIQAKPGRRRGRQENKAVS